MYDLNERPENPATAPNQAGDAQAAPTQGSGQFNPFEAAEKEIETTERTRRATGATLNAQKLISEGLEAVLVFESDRRRRADEPISDEALMQQVMAKQNDWMQFVGSQSKEMLSRLAEAGHDVASDATKARVTSEVAHYTATFYKAIGDKVFEVDVASELEKADRIEGLHTRAERSDSDGQSVEARRASALMRAMDPVMSAYQRFDFLHRDTESVMARMRDLIRSHVDHTLDAHPAIETMNESDQQALEGNLLYRAGRLLGQCWESHISEATNWLASVPAEYRRDLHNTGYPLEPIEQAFSDYYRVVEQTTLASLSANMGDEQRDQVSPSPAPA